MDSESCKKTSSKNLICDNITSPIRVELFQSDSENITRLHRCAVYADREALNALDASGEISPHAAAAYADQIRDAIRLLTCAVDKYDRAAAAAGGVQ